MGTETTKEELAALCKEYEAMPNANWKNDRAFWLAQAALHYVDVEPFAGYARTEAMRVLCESMDLERAA